MRILQAVRNQAARIASQIEDSNLFTQMGDRGNFRERIIADFLRPFLPPCYGLGTGEVFSTDGQQSAQIDILLYDAIFSTVLFRDEKISLFPAESVFGLIEVKSNLNGNELRRSIENVASLKRLSRPDSDAADFTPILRFNVGPSLGFTGGKMNPYLGYVFGYEGISPETVTVELNQTLTRTPGRRHDLPDLVFVLHPGYMIARTGPDATGKQQVCGPGLDFAQFQYVMTDEDTLPLFYMALNISLSSVRLRSVNFHSLWQQLFSQVVNRAQ